MYIAYTVVVVGSIAYAYVLALSSRYVLTNRQLLKACAFAGDGRFLFRHEKPHGWLGQGVREQRIHAQARRARADFAERASH